MGSIPQKKKRPCDFCPYETTIKWKSHEFERKYKVKMNLGTDGHVKKALKSHVSFNSLRVGSP